VKTAVIATLASPSQLVRSQIASLIAAIAVIEIPRG
jgi:importin subunit beta-1